MVANASGGERRRHFRGKSRPGRRVGVEYCVVQADGEEGMYAAAFTHNIGIGGAFIVTPDPPPPGAAVKISLRVPGIGGERAVVVRGEVRWIADDDEDDPKGMGVRFFGLSVEEVLLLNEYFASLTRVADADELG